MYYEDSDLCFRIKEQGYDIINVPSAEIIHLEGKSFNVSKDRDLRYFGGRQHYFRKHYSVAYNWIADSINITTLTIATVLCRLTGKKDAWMKYHQRLIVYRELINK